MNLVRGVRRYLREHDLASSALLAALILVPTLVGQVTGGGPDQSRPLNSTPLSTALAVIACLVLVLRRRNPVAVWATIVVIGQVCVVIEGDVGQTVLPTMVALYTVASWRPWRTAIAAALATAVIYATTATIVTGSSLFVDSTYALLGVGGMACAIGIAVRGQRAVLRSAQERAEAAEQGREEEAQRRVTEERLRIARELHDVVAHHISVINVQAGVARHLLTSDPVAADEALGHVREASQVVITEMGTILGLLRTPDDPATTAPAPGLGQVDALVDSLRRAGLDVAWTVTGSPTTLGPGTDLTAYRLVQESLTNARKHGSGRASLTITYTPTAVTIDVSNAVGAGVEDLGSGHGLVGMQERVLAVGGTLEAGPTGHGHYVVHATLPVDTAAARLPVGGRG